MTACIVPFPADRMIGKIRHVVAILGRKHGREADRYWRQVTLGLRARMHAAQVDPEAIDFQIRIFANEVFSRLPSGKSNNPGGAA